MCFKKDARLDRSVSESHSMGNSGGKKKVLLIVGFFRAFKMLVL